MHTRADVVRDLSARVLVAGVIVVLVVGCRTVPLVERQLVRPEQVGRLDQSASDLKVHLRDGRLYVLSAWRVDEQARTIAGQGRLFGPSRQPPAPPQEGDVSVSFDDVALFETNHVRGSGTVTAFSVVTGISLAVTAYCAANPKSCFGSCPTFYVSDGERLHLEAEGFSGSVLPSLAATDTDALFRARTAGGRLEVRMLNEAYETHVVERVELLAAPRPKQGRVFAGPAGTFWQTRHWRTATSCVAREGDCREALASVDGRPRTSQADPSNLAERESLELVFPPATGRQALVVASSQSLMSTYLFYQTLAHMGRDASFWLSRLETGDPQLRAGLQRLERMLGRIEVLALDASGQWRPIGEVGEQGPLATDITALPLPEDLAEPVRIRLRLTQGLWRLDAVALADLVGAVKPARLAPSRMRLARRSQYHDETPRAEWPLVTLPGDEWRLVFDLPADMTAPEVFLVSRGYYLEWMRDEWLADEDPLEVARLFATPETVLREWAEAYKRVEPGMDAAFWGSRYAQH